MLPYNKVLVRIDPAGHFYCPTALLPYCPTALLPYCLLPYCPTALLPYCPTRILGGYIRQNSSL
ncbi:MAG: hypothetical protein E5X58_05085 [Mesorhizobium sp.]|nr:MAG: hypothetical protein E5X58_05085 [Mesorhizobium sp.]